MSGIGNAGAVAEQAAIRQEGVVARRMLELAAANDRLAMIESELYARLESVLTGEAPSVRVADVDQPEQSELAKMLYDQIERINVVIERLDNLQLRIDL